ncbi:Ankyrin repeat domain-containing protein 16-like [Oopsacas minuta]|uniref:Ankyrin repeat domain-containing protein 16-like n=1 Tax=Oopsacas minuta TaxID=111878 RepID=A0AAV7JDP7_9METZ|nr:Ankyrin repeat domain-containing protein 16-like [Oopsacas minuta]
MNRIFIHPKDPTLSQACITGDTHLVRHILNTCFDVGNLLSQQNRDGKTALHEACIHSQLDCVRLLLEAGSDANALKRGDWTPLMLACTRDNIEIIKLLVNAGSRLDLKNKDGWNTFMIACRQGNISTLQYLFEVDNKVSDCVSNNGRTPLHTAAINNQHQVLVFLLKHCYVDINLRDVCGVTPLMDACRLHNTTGMMLLLEIGARSDILDKLGRTALHIAAEAGTNECIYLLLTKTGLCVNSKANNGMTPLHYAMRERHEAAVSTLLALGADIAIKDSYGRTAKILSDLCRNTKPILTKT